MDKPAKEASKKVTHQEKEIDKSVLRKFAEIYQMMVAILQHNKGRTMARGNETVEKYRIAETKKEDNRRPELSTDLYANTVVDDEIQFTVNRH